MLRYRSFLLLAILGCQSPAESAGLPGPIDLVAIPTVGGSYLAWLQVDGAVSYTVRYRTSESEPWIEAPALPGTTTATEIGGLPSAPISIVLSARNRRGEAVAEGLRSVVPRAGAVGACARLEQYDAQGSLVGFCDQASLEHWLERNAISRTALTCRGSAAPATGVLPDCSYHLNRQAVLLARGLDEEFDAQTPVPDPEDTRRLARQILYGSDDVSQRIASTAVWSELETTNGLVALSSTAQSFAISVPGTPFTSRITWFAPPVAARGVAIYLEGHTISAIEAGAPTIDSLLSLGWEVVAVDMPLQGRNAPDLEELSPRDDIILHDILIPNDLGGIHPIGQMLLPIEAVVNRVKEVRSHLPLMLVGRSGGGWSSYIYGALDARVDAVVSIAGGVPMSRRLAGIAFSLGDYEQAAPEFYDFVSHEALMASAGRLGALFTWSDQDFCCHRISPTDPYVGWLRGVSRPDHLVEVVVQTDVIHGLNAAGYGALRAFVEQLFP